MIIFTTRFFFLACLCIVEGGFTLFVFSRFSQIPNEVLQTIPREKESRIEKYSSDDRFPDTKQQLLTIEELGRIRRWRFSSEALKRAGEKRPRQKKRGRRGWVLVPSLATPTQTFREACLAISEEVADIPGWFIEQMKGPFLDISLYNPRTFRPWTLRWQEILFAVATNWSAAEAEAAFGARSLGGAGGLWAAVHCPRFAYSLGDRVEETHIYQMLLAGYRTKQGSVPVMCGEEGGRSLRLSTLYPETGKCGYCAPIILNEY